MRTLRSTLFSIAIAACLAGAAGATPVVFFGEDAGLGDHNGKLYLHPNADAARAEFMSHLEGVGTEDFEGLTRYSAPPLNLLFPGAGTATVTGGGQVMDDRFGPSWNTAPRPGEEFYGRFAVSGHQYLGQVFAPGFSVSFSDPVAAFGFYATDVGDFSGSLSLGLVGGESLVVDIPHAINGNGGSVLYMGVIDVESPFTSVRFQASSGTDVFGFDDLTVGALDQVDQGVPEPGTLALVGVGLVVLAVARRRRRA
jgi:hypothetical protein